MNKLCRICHEEKPLLEFGVNRHIKSGTNSICKVCGAVATAEYRKRTYVPKPPRVANRQSREEFKAKQREWREANKASIAARVAKWQAANRARRAASTAKYRSANPDAVRLSYEVSKVRNPGWIAIRSAKKRALKKNAQPPWSIQFFIDEAYSLAQLRSKTTGIKWEVDHIVPLKHKDVCGLHAHTNIRVIPEFLNRSKGNKLTEATYG